MNLDSIRSLFDTEQTAPAGEAWLIASVLFVVIAGGLWITHRIFLSRFRKLAGMTKTDVDDFIAKLLGHLGIGTFATISLYLSTRNLELSPTVHRGIGIFFTVVMTVTVVRLLERAAVFFLEKGYDSKDPADLTRRTAIRNMKVIARVVLWGACLVFLLDNMGIQITGLVAGLGIGGIAVALAAQAMLADAFASFAIFMDKPFEVGDFLVIGDYKGTVEYVGFKTTRIRSLGGEQLVFGNTDLTSSRIQNYKRMQERRIVFGLGVIYQTSRETMGRIPGMIRSVIEGTEGTRFDRAHFSGFGDSSLNFEVVYYVLSPDYNRYMDIQQAINLGIMEKFEAEGIEFAYPTRTLFVSGTTEPAAQAAAGTR